MPLEALLRGSPAAPSTTLSHWCWYICDHGLLAEAAAATNYAIEGATGEWAHLVCSSDRYAASLPEERREACVRAHAYYDDGHPWETLEIVASILGAQPSSREIGGIRAAIRRSYEYMQITLDDCLADGVVSGSSPTSQERAG